MHFCFLEGASSLEGHYYVTSCVGHYHSKLHSRLGHVYNLDLSPEILHGGASL